MALRNRDARIEALRSIPTFANLPKSDLQILARNSMTVDEPAGVLLCREGQPVRQLTYIASGEAVVERNGQEIARLGPGAVIGELGLIDGQPASATVTTTTPVTLLVMSVGDFQQVMNGSANFHIKLLKALAQRLRDADAKLVD